MGWLGSTAAIAASSWLMYAARRGKSHSSYACGGLSLGVVIKLSVRCRGVSSGGSSRHPVGSASGVERDARSADELTIALTCEVADYFTAAPATEHQGEITADLGALTPVGPIPAWHGRPLLFGGPGAALRLPIEARPARRHRDAQEGARRLVTGRRLRGQLPAGPQRVLASARRRAAVRFGRPLRRVGLQGC